MYVKQHIRQHMIYMMYSVQYSVKEGCTWRGIPHDFPKRTTARYHYDIWAEEDETGISLLDKILHKLIEAERKENGREDKTTMIIVDSRSVQNTDTDKIKGYDAVKKSQV